MQGRRAPRRPSLGVLVQGEHDRQAFVVHVVAHARASRHLSTSEHVKTTILRAQSFRTLTRTLATTVARTP
eukprot:11387201-Alexandrium_andersonii.AAC.1